MSILKFYFVSLKFNKIPMCVNLLLKLGYTKKQSTMNGENDDVKDNDEKDVRRSWRHFGVFVVNFKHISHLFWVYLLMTSNK